MDLEKFVLKQKLLGIDIVLHDDGSISLQSGNINEFRVPEGVPVEYVAYKFRCNNLILGNGCSDIPKNFMDTGCSVKNIVITSSYCRVSDSAFNGVGNLESIKFCGDALLGIRSFKNCTGLKKVEFEGSRNAIIFSESFYNCQSLKEISGTESMQYIELQDGIFVNCKSLKSLVLADNTLLSYSSFSSCSGLKEITFKDVEFGKTCSQMFYDCSDDLVINLPEKYSSKGNLVRYFGDFYTHINFY